MDTFSVKPCLTETAVDQAIAAGRGHAAALDGAFTIVVVDDSAVPRGLFRMDTADLLTVELASGKARLVAANGMPTFRWREIVAGDPYLGLTVPTALDRVLGGAVLYAGGYPIRVQGTTIGGIGVSGGAEADDDEVARAALASLPQAEQFSDRAAR